jgi:hypothetical protein
MAAEAPIRFLGEVHYAEVDSPPGLTARAHLWYRYRHREEGGQAGPCEVILVFRMMLYTR